MPIWLIIVLASIPVDALVLGLVFRARRRKITRP